MLLTNKEVPAGGRGEIEITLKTSSYPGPLNKSIYIYSNDGENKVIRLTVSADVIKK
ncbi:MAG: DUF1573 domain-containing protein [Spirochaetes bacterium]|nr:DUF1573 domain-containing protein [Spirochaetota bacterium]